MTFGKKLQMIDRIKGISQADIRRGINRRASSGAISNWFNEKYIPDGDVCLIVARFVGVPLEILVDPSVTEEEFEKHLRGHDAMDPDQRAMFDLAKLYGWRTLVDRVTSINRSKPDVEPIVLTVSSDPTKPGVQDGGYQRSSEDIEREKKEDGRRRLGEKGQAIKRKNY